MSRKRSRRPSRPSRPKAGQIEQRGAALARETETERDSGVESGLEVERDSGVESSPLAADADDDESELERHFFSQAPAEETPGAPRVAPSSLAPSSLTLRPEADDRQDTATEPEDREERESFRLHRDRLRKHVFVTMGGATALLLLGLVLNGRADAQRQQDAASAARVFAAVPETDQVADAPTLLRRAEQELDAGHGQQAAELARSAVSLVPHQAEPYLLLAGALQDLGKFDEAREAFRNCVEHAQSGPVASCRSFAAQ